MHVEAVFHVELRSGDVGQEVLGEVLIVGLSEEHVGV